MIKHTQTIHGQQSTNCLSVFDHFVGLVFKGSINIMTNKWFKWTNSVNDRQECTYSWLEKISNISLIVLLFYKIFSKMACMLGQFFSQMQKTKYNLSRVLSFAFLLSLQLCITFDLNCFISSYSYYVLLLHFFEKRKKTKNERKKRLLNIDRDTIFVWFCLIFF